MARLHRNKLLVEGDQDKRVIPELIEQNGIHWGTRENPTVYIEAYDGYTQLIDPIEISTQLDSSDLVALGIIVDADEDAARRWQALRNACLPSISDLPEELPEAGLIHRASNGVNFGIWIMPNNRISGMLETFLAFMIPDDRETLWQYAQEAATEAKKRGAPYTETQCDKANIYSWLAWQDPPGRQLHQAIMQRILNSKNSGTQAFVEWFRTLYGL
ncbi:DUF3226 domain-containing protein [Phormidesmis sp. 146-35]